MQPQNLELNFKTDVDIEIDYDSVKPQGHEYEDRSSSADGVQYNVAITTRSWGISNISYYMIRQEISCYVTLQPNDSDDSESYLFKIKIEDCETEGPEDIIGRDLTASSLSLTLTEVNRIDDHTFEAKAKATLSF